MELQDRVKLLRHMLEHNTEHTEELLEMEKNFWDLGETETASQIQLAVEVYRRGNSYLQKALQHLN